MSRPPKAPPPGTARLFGERQSSAPASVYIANIDGASRGNPGPAAYGVIVRDPAGKIIFELGRRFGRDTNNVAEYYGLLAALDYASSHSISSLRVRSDSELLVRQMQGRYKVKSPDLQPLHERASRLSRQLSYFAIEHVPREMNREADALANAALDSPSGRAAASQRDLAEAERSTSAAKSLPIASEQTRPLRIRARFTNGVLIPAEPLQLPEGADLRIEIRIPAK